MKNKATRGKEDRISSLPDDVRLQILRFLPLSEAVKTSLLSTQWRNLWTNLQSLNFDENCGVTVPARYNYDRNAVNALMLKLCKILLLHRGPLIDFSLSLAMLRRFPDQIELILLLLQDKHVESLTMRTTRWFLVPPSPENTEDYKLPMRLLTSFSQLKTLRLSDCQLKWSPISFEGFRILTVLELRNVVFKDHSDLWRFRLPMLSSLTLDSCAGSTLSPHIVIEAPNLGCFHFVGFYQSLHLKHTPVLKNAIIHKRRLMFSSNLQDKSNLLRIWGDLASVESLCVADHFYQGLGIEDEDINLSPWVMLSHMTLNDICLRRRFDAWSLVRMITNSPNLQRLEIAMKQGYDTEMPMLRFNGEVLDVNEFRDRVECKDGVSKFELSRLKRVEVKCVKDTEHEMALIRWLLSSSPALARMEIRLSAELPDATKMMVLTRLNGFQRRSMEAQIDIS